MRLIQDRLEIVTRGQGLHEISAPLSAWVEQQAMTQGLLTLFLRHTSASLLIQENAAPEVQSDLEDFFRALAPEDAARYRHRDEGPDDMPAHIRAALLPTSLAIPVAQRRLALGTWQGVFVVEHRRAPHRREVFLHLAGL
jgi:secondary thiamine-phosphate synthase enzyme